MKFEKIIAVFLLLVLSIQMLPLRQIAAWLASGQATEEFAHADRPVTPGPDEIKHPCLPAAYHFFPENGNTPAIARYLKDEALFHRYQDDILTPPPNRA